MVERVHGRAPAPGLPRRDTGPEPLIGRAGTVAMVAGAVLDGCSTVIAGARGVGKSAVLAAVTAELELRHCHLLRTSGTRGTTSRPFAALGELVPGLEADEVGVDRLRRAARHLATVGGDRRTVLAIDDLDLLDTGTLAVIQQLCGLRRIELVATVLIDETISEAVTVLWKEGHAQRVELEPLARPDADRHLEALVGGPVEAASRQRLWNLTGGNPLYLQEVVTAPRAAGSWTRQPGGLWRAPADLRVREADPSRVSGSPTEQNLPAGLSVRARLDDCQPDVRDIVEALALAERLPLRVIEQMRGTAAAAEAERSRLIVLDQDPVAGLVGRLGHPFAAQILRGELDRERALMLWRLIVDGFAALDDDPPTGPDLLVLAEALVEVADVADGAGSLLLAAAQQARAATDFSRVERFARRAWDLTGDPDAALWLADAVVMRGGHAELNLLMEELARTAVTEAQRCAMARGTAVALFHSDRAEAGFALLAGARGRTTDPEQVAWLSLLEAKLRFFHGDLAQARELVVPYTAHPGVALRCEAASVLCPLLMAAGRGEEAVGVAERAFADAGAHLDAVPLMVLGVHYLFRLGALSDLGRLAEAEAGAIEVEPIVAASGDPTVFGWLSLHLGRVALRRGRPKTAARWFRESVASLTDVNRPGWLVWPSAGLVAALATAGVLDEAGEARAALDHIGPHPAHVNRLEVDRYLACHDAALGDLGGARDRLYGVIRAAARIGHRPAEVEAWHELARLQLDVDAAAHHLARLSRIVDGELVEAHARQARALAAGDWDGLSIVAEAYEALGADLDAAESWSAAVLHVGERSTDAARHRERAAWCGTRAADRCEGATTPLLPAGTGGPRITDRERQILALVSEGRTRHDIADSLFLSVRTVDSHLQRIYRKYGVHTRRELIAMLPQGLAFP